MPGQYLDDPSWLTGLGQKIWAVIPAPPEIEPDLRKGLERRLDHLHEFSLRKRLKELAKKFAPLLEDLLGDANSFADTVSDLRSKLTHASAENAEIEKDYRKLLQLSDKMTLLLEVGFLAEIGFDPERIKEILHNRSKRAFRIHKGWF